jgi:energy-coupling factor transporter ATP-binding protein EcfA2
MDALISNPPETIAEFAGNRFLVRKIYEHATKGTHLVIFGPTGCGKTTLCRIFQKTIKYKSFYEVNKDSFSSVKEMINSIKNFITNRSIETYFARSTGSNKRAIFIDDYDILVNTDKTLPSSLVSEVFPLMESHNIQLVITCITDYNIKKKMQDALKQVEIMKLTYPQPKEAFAYLLANFGTALENREERILELLNKYKGSIRDAMLHLDTPNDTEVTSMNFKDMSQFEVVKALFTKSPITQEDMKYILLNDVSNIVYLLYENLPEELCHNRVCGASADKAINTYLQILNFFAETGEIETFGFNVSDWKLYDSANMLRMEMLRQVFNDMPSKAANLRKDSQLRFTQLLSKMSHRNIFYRRLENIRARTHLNYEQLIKALEDTPSNAFKKNTDESNILITYKKYFSGDK